MTRHGLDESLSHHLVGRRVDALGEGRALDVLLLARAGALPAVPRVARALLLSADNANKGEIFKRDSYPFIIRGILCSLSSPLELGTKFTNCTLYLN